MEILWKHVIHDDRNVWSTAENEKVKGLVQEAMDICHQ